MSRPLRIEFPNALYHITSRGNERRNIFRDDSDKKNFLRILHEVNKKYNWLCHAYCLMTNHYHLVIETPDANLSKGMRQLNGVYTQTFNRKYERVGHIFQGRYKGIIVQKETNFLCVCRYVVLNPVRAKIVDLPEEWGWSSYNATANLEKPHPCLCIDGLLLCFSSQKSEAHQKYREYIIAGIREESIWKDLKAQFILGNDDFVKKLYTKINFNDKKIEEINRQQRFLYKPTLVEIFNVTLNNSKTRNEKIIEAVIKHGYTQKEVSEYLGMHYSNVSKIIISGLENSRFKT